MNAILHKNVSEDLYILKKRCFEFNNVEHESYFVGGDRNFEEYTVGASNLNFLNNIIWAFSVNWLLVDSEINIKRCSFVEK